MINNEIVGHNSFYRSYQIRSFLSKYYNKVFHNQKWIFGQYTLALLEKDHKELINKMIEKGWIK